MVKILYCRFKKMFNRVVHQLLPPTLRNIIGKWRQLMHYYKCSQLFKNPFLILTKTTLSLEKKHVKHMFKRKELKINFPLLVTCNASFSEKYC